MNTDGGIESDVRVKSKRLETLTVARGLVLLDWVKEIIRGRRFLFSDLSMVSKAIIGGAP